MSEPEETKDYDRNCQDQIIRAVKKKPFLLRSNEEQALIYAAERIQQLESERRWIPVSERLPDVDRLTFTIVAVKHKKDLPPLVCLNPFRPELGVWSESPKVTHWMPLPPPPINGEVK